MKHKLLWGTHSLIENGSRVRYEIGNIIENVPIKYLEKWPDRFELIEEDESIQDKLKQYNEGYGWYKLPGTDRKVRKQEALEILKESDKNA